MVRANNAKRKRASGNDYGAESVKVDRAGFSLLNVRSAETNKRLRTISMEVFYFEMGLLIIFVFLSAWLILKIMQAHRKHASFIQVMDRLYSKNIISARPLLIALAYEYGFPRHFDGLLALSPTVAESFIYSFNNQLLWSAPFWGNVNMDHPFDNETVNVSICNAKQQDELKTLCDGLTYTINLDAAAAFYAQLETSWRNPPAGDGTGPGAVCGKMFKDFSSASLSSKPMICFSICTLLGAGLPVNPDATDTGDTLTAVTTFYDCLCGKRCVPNPPDVTGLEVASTYLSSAGGMGGLMMPLFMGGPAGMVVGAMGMLLGGLGMGSEQVYHQKMQAFTRCQSQNKTCLQPVNPDSNTGTCSANEVFESTDCGEEPAKPACAIM